ncbi:hypothetical protein ACPA0F_08960 [Solibacillus silvestris]
MTYKEAIYILAGDFSSCPTECEGDCNKCVESATEMAIKALEEKAETLSLTIELSEEQIAEWKKIIYGSEEDAKAIELAYKTINEVLPKYKEAFEKQEKLVEKLSWLLSYVTNGRFSNTTYSIEEMRTMVDDAIQDQYDEWMKLEVNEE